MGKSNNSNNEVEEAGTISAIWILTNNDENPIITYYSIYNRLGLPDSYDVRGLIKRHRELFRLKAPRFRLEQWKKQLYAGKKLPAWLTDIENIEERKKAIESLTTEDVFRSQFRTKADSEASSIEIINWGLEHIERLRKAKIETKEGGFKKWKEVWIPLGSIFASLLIAVGTIAITSYWNNQNIYIQYKSVEIQNKSIETQKQLKELELSYKPKLESYLSFLQKNDECFDFVVKRRLSSKKITEDNFQLIDCFRKLDNSFYALEPFLQSDKKQELELRLSFYKNSLRGIDRFESDGNLKKTIDESLKESDFMKKELFKELFEQTSLEK
ncbi:MAG: hypothetical protein WA584_17165 [Pyrinomonadaceae bacterium]